LSRRTKNLFNGRIHPWDQFNFDADKTDVVSVLFTLLSLTLTDSRREPGEAQVYIAAHFRISIGLRKSYLLKKEALDNWRRILDSQIQQIR
jgi:hypothetical protein